MIALNILKHFWPLFFLLPTQPLIPPPLHKFFHITPSPATQNLQSPACPLPIFTESRFASEDTRFLMLAIVSPSMNFMFKRNWYSSCSPCELPSGYISFWSPCHHAFHLLIVKVCRHPVHLSVLEDTGTRLTTLFSGPEPSIYLSNDNIYPSDPSSPWFPHSQCSSRSLHPRATTWICHHL